MKKHFLNILKIAFASGLIAWLLMTDRLNPERLWHAPRPEYFLLALVLVGVQLALVNWRWMVLLRGQNLHFSFAATMKLTLIGVFFGFALPSSVGGDAVKAFILAKNNAEARLTVVNSVFMDRLFGLIAMLLMALMAMAIDFANVNRNLELRLIATSALVLTTGLLAFLAFAFLIDLEKSRRVKKIVDMIPVGLLLRLYSDIRRYTRSKKALVIAIGISFLAQLSTNVFMMTIAHAVGAEGIDTLVFFTAVPIGFMVMSVPIAPAGIGVGQVAFLTLFQLYSGTDTDLGSTVITAQQVGLFVYGLLGAYYYTRESKFIAAASEP